MTTQPSAPVHSEKITEHVNRVDTRSAKYIARLRFQFLTPIIGTLTFAVLVIIAVVFYREYQTIDSNVIRLQSTSQSLFQANITQNAKALQITLDILKTDPLLHTALEQQNRIQLLKRTRSIYEDLNRHYGITHFYFSTPERVNLLRVHKPEKYNDTINRHTTITAERSGTDSYGVELGPLGTLTLRYVQPWYQPSTGKLIGFVELGMEIDRTFNAISEMFNVDLFLLIHKKHLEQKGWEDGMRTFGRMPDWNRFTQTVISVHGNQRIPDELTSQITKIDFDTIDTTFKLRIPQKEQYAIFQPIHDIRGQIVGTMIMFFDITSLAKQVKESVIIGSVVVILSAVVLSIFFYWFVGKIGMRLATNEKKLQEMAIHDALTGLFNRRQFSHLLDEAIARFSRYKNPIALLMIDIDHFKRVNDTYGHSAGDLVLVEIARELSEHSRIHDSVCRFGGEEFTILLPECDSHSAYQYAQRLRHIIEETAIEFDDGIELKITISIGIAACPAHATSKDPLLKAADDALYRAKANGRNRVELATDLSLPDPIAS